MKLDEINSIVTQLTALNERELIDVLNKVFEVFGDKFDREEINPDFGDRYALVRTNFSKEDPAEPYITVLCVPSEPFLLSPHDEAIESGRCPTCGVFVVCTDKLATCPICGTTHIECT